MMINEHDGTELEYRIRDEKMNIAYCGEQGFGCIVGIWRGDERAPTAAFIWANRAIAKASIIARMVSMMKGNAKK